MNGVALSMRSRATQAVGARQTGSVLMLALFVCLSCAVLCLSLGYLIRLSGEMKISEEAGRDQVARATGIFVEARDRSLYRWGEGQEFEFQEAAVTVEGLQPTEQWRMGVQAVCPSSTDGLRKVASQWCSCIIERGLDGMDLPAAVLVAELCLAAPGRSAPVLSGEVSGATPVYLSFPELSVVPIEVPVRRLPERWQLDEGTRTRIKNLSPNCGNVLILEGRPGQLLQVDLPSYDGGGGVGGDADGGEGAGAGSAPQDPVLIVATGGADLALTQKGEVHGVIVVDGGSLILDDTRLSGAVFVSQNVYMGETGVLIFDANILRWATDSSLPRVRLMPGTRAERWLE